MICPTLMEWPDWSCGRHFYILQDRGVQYQEMSGAAHLSHIQALLQQPAMHWPDKHAQQGIVLQKTWVLPAGTGLWQRISQSVIPSTQRAAESYHKRNQMLAERITRISLFPERNEQTMKRIPSDYH